MPSPDVECRPGASMASSMVTKARNRSLDGRPVHGPAKANSGKVLSMQPAETRANAAMHPFVVSEEVFCASKLKAAAFYADENVLVFNMEVGEALRLLAAHQMQVNCIVTSPPFYGQ